MTVSPEAGLSTNMQNAGKTILNPYHDHDDKLPILYFKEFIF